MPSWNIKNIRASRESNYVVVQGLSNKGDVYPTKSLFVGRTGGVQFLTKGEVGIYNSDMELRATFDRATRFYAPNPELGDLHDKIVNIATVKDDTIFYCIMSLDTVAEWTGEVVDVKAGDTITINNLQGKRIFLADEGVTVSGILYEQHRIIHFQNTDTVTVSAGVSDAVIAILYQV